MIQFYDTRDDMHNARPENGTEGMISDSDMLYMYNSLLNTWFPITQVHDAHIPNADDIDHTGTFQTNVNSTIISKSSTDTEITKCKSTRLLCLNLEHPTTGIIYSFVDTYGSTIDPAVDHVKENIDLNGNINGTINLLGNSSISNYPFAGVGFDFIDNGDAETADKITTDLSDYTGIKFNYKSSQILKVKLMDKLSDDGSSWYAELPIATVATDITFTWASFAQPSWISASQVRDIPTSAIVGINIQYETENSSMTFELNSIDMTGTGYLVPSGINITTDEITETMYEKIETWFASFYVENESQLLGRIKWLDENHTDPDVTVSEGIGYAMLLAVTVGNDVYREKFDKLWKFYVVNENSNGLMDWKVTGFNNVVLESGSAVDADLNVALALSHAYETWHNDSYLTNAKFIFNAIYVNEVESTTGKYLLKPGDSWDDYKNPSYVNIPAIIMAEIYDTDNDWNTVYEDNLWLLQQNQILAANHSLPSNWCDNVGNPVVGTTAIGFGYDASRVLQHMHSGYFTNFDERLKTYLNLISDEVELKTRATSVTAIADTSLTITSTAWGTDNNSIGLGSIMTAYLLNSALTEAQLDTMLADIIATDDDDDYYNGVLKCINLAGCLEQLTRKVVCIDSAVNNAFIVSYGVEEADDQKVQVYYSDTTGVRYRIDGGPWVQFQMCGCEIPDIFALTDMTTCSDVTSQNLVMRIDGMGVLHIRGDIQITAGVKGTIVTRVGVVAVNLFIEDTSVYFVSSSTDDVANAKSLMDFKLNLNTDFIELVREDIYAGTFNVNVSVDVKDLLI